MGTLPEGRIATLLEPYVQGEEFPGTLIPQLSTYLDLLMKWNSRTNLTAIRDPEEIVRRHFGESLFAGRQIAARVSGGARLLDYGSGAGFPGLPIQMLAPELRVSLAESQGKKASFLREVARTLRLGTTVWAGRVEDMPEEDIFEVVTLRAVDRMEEALAAARRRVNAGGWLVTLSTEKNNGAEAVRMPGSVQGWVVLEQVKS